MALITSNVTGTLGTPALWSVSGTWVGGNVPVSGTDTVLIAGGAVVALDSAACTASSLTVGTDGGTGTTGLTVGTIGQTTAANLIVNTGLTLRMQGDLYITGQSGAAPKVSSIITFQAGSSLILDPPNTGTPGQYVVYLSNGAEMIFNGTSNGTWPDSLGGNHCVFKTDLTRTGLAGYMNQLGGFPTGDTWGGIVTATYTDFSNLGTATKNGVLTNIHCSYGQGTTGNISITNCNFNACSYWVLAENGSWTGNYTFSNNIFTSSVASTGILSTYAIGFTIVTTGTYTISTNSFDLPVILDHMTTGTMAITGNVFAQSVVKANVPSWASDSCFNYNVIVQTAVINFSLGPIRDCYFLRNTSSSISSFQMLVNASATSCVFEQTTGNGSGSVIIEPGTNGCVIKKCFVLPAPGDSKAAGSLVAPQATTGLVCEHNLQWGGAPYGMVAGGRLGTSVAGGVASCQGNIGYWPTTAANYNLAVSEFTDAGNILDFVTLAGHNGFRNPSSGTCKYNNTAGSATVVGYSSISVTAATAFAAEGGGAGNTQIQSGYDFTADPQFTDSARNAAKWNKVIDGGLNDNAGTQTFAAALASLQANPSLTQGAGGLINYVRAGFVPANTAYRGTSYSGDSLATDANGNAWYGATPEVGPMAFPASAVPFAEPIYMIMAGNLRSGV